MRNLFGPDVIIKNPKDKNKVEHINYDIWKYRVFDSVYKSLYRVDNVREVVLAMDDRRSWRKLYWTKYKSHRKDSREKLDIDWTEYFQVYDSFMEEIQQAIPFKVLKCKDTEADDIIGELVISKPQDFYIISTDKDFLQLSSKRVKIYNPLKRVLVDHPNPELFLVEECFKGQAKDNIYNVKTPLDHPEGKRKPGFGEKAFEKVLVYGWEQWLEDNNLRDRYEFNRNLMDFKRIPGEIRRRINRDYDNYKNPDPNDIYEFFKKQQWPEYLENFTNVENRLLQLF